MNKQGFLYQGFFLSPSPPSPLPPVLLGIKGEATEQARTGGWDQEVLGKENHAGEMRKIYRSRSV